MKQIYREMTEKGKTKDVYELVSSIYYLGPWQDGKDINGGNKKRSEPYEVRVEKKIIEDESPLFMPTAVIMNGKTIGMDEGNIRVFYEPIARRERLVILGGGHIGKVLCEFAGKTGFEPWIVDERKEFADKGRFPEAKEVICEPFEKALDRIQIRERDFVVIVTRGHRCDGLCLSYLFRHTMPYYTGMIGSRKRVEAQMEEFREQGIGEEKIKKVHTPIGLSIKAVTPEEIAVSILGELILEKRSMSGQKAIRSDLDYTVLEKAAQETEPAAMVTIVSAEGSSPRKAGAKMLVRFDGGTEGSIGGGLAEKEAICLAGKIIGTGKAIIYSFAMDASAAADEGMACGGRMEILIEDITMGVLNRYEDIPLACEG